MTAAPTHGLATIVALDPPFRCATPADASALAELANMAGEGMPLHLWARMAGPGDTPWDLGRARARGAHGSFSHRNAVVAEVDGQVVASLVGYRLPDAPRAIDLNTKPAMLVPMQQLENLAPGTFYVNFLATRPADRRQGYGARLLSIADRMVSGTDASGLSIIVADGNENARRFYEKCGYSSAAARPMVKEDWENPGENWLLLTKAL